MPAGLELYDANGGLAFKGTDRLVRFIGWSTFGPGDGYIQDARFLEGELIVSIIPDDDETLTRPSFYFNSDGFGWTYAALQPWEGPTTGYLFYGVF
jgi:hypothetical protein